MLNDTIEQIAGNGIRHKSDKISHETMKLVPGIYAQEIHKIDLKPIFAALFDQLEIRTRDQFAFSALLRHREVLGEAEFSRISNQMEPRQRNTFRTLGQSYENKDYHLSKKRSRDGASFGMVPNSIINKLLDKHNRTMRTEGAIMLKRQLEKEATDSSLEQTDRFGLLLPYVGSFIKFLGGLLSDASPKVIYKCSDKICY